MRPRTYIIAEIGVNHNGSIDLAKELVASAKACGADAVKFQTFKADRLVTSGTPKVAYQKRTTDETESHHEMIRRLELSEKDHEDIFHYCKQCDIEFISTPYDVESVEFLQSLGVTKFKVASADIVDLPLLQAIAKTGVSTILSAGMATLGEIEDAVFALRPHAKELCLLHCVSNYPCSDSSLNLDVIPTLRHAFGIPVGFSDHSIGSQAATLAVALGAETIEKHFTVDRGLLGPDHAASSTPGELAELIQSVRRTEVMLGSPVKCCQPEEREMARLARKSLTLATAKEVGTILCDADLTTMRPGTGIAPKNIDKVVGRTLRRSLAKNHQLDWTDLE